MGKETKKSKGERGTEFQRCKLSLAELYFDVQSASILKNRAIKTLQKFSTGTSLRLTLQ